VPLYVLLDATGKVSVGQLPVGTATGTVAAGDDTRLSGNARTANNLSDLASALTARANLALGNVDNTSDVNKPVSTAQQTALNNKVAKGELVLNVKDYGALGDGVADDTTGLQAWLDAIKSQKRPGYLPAGNYKITATLSLTQLIGCRIYGDSTSVHSNRNGSRIVWAGAAGGTMFLYQGVRNGMLSGFELDGAGIAGIGLDFDAVSGGFAAVYNQFIKMEFGRCTVAGVNIAKSNFQLDESTFIDCMFMACNSSATPVMGAGTACGVSIHDANSVWHQFRTCAWSGCDIGISSVQSGTGGHFGINGGRFGGNYVCDIKPFNARTCAIVDTHSEMSYQFLADAGVGSTANAPVSLIGCSINGIREPNGVGIRWNRPVPLILIGCDFASQVSGKPFQIQVGHNGSRGTCIAKGCVFMEGNPFGGTTYAYISAEGCVYANSLPYGNPSTIVPANTGDVPRGTPAVPAGTLNAAPGSAPQTDYSNVVWVKVATGTALTGGANVFYLKNLNCNGNARPQLETLHGTGGSDTVLLGIHGTDDNATNPNTARIVVRCTGAFTLTSDLVFALRLRNEPVTYG
jgi:hypothetical protein